MKRLHFTLSPWLGLSLLNKQSNDFIVVLRVFEYECDTNHPTDLAKKYYFKYSHSVEITKHKNEKRQEPLSQSELIVMVTPDYRILHRTEEDMIDMIRTKLGYELIPN